MTFIEWLKKYQNYDLYILYLLSLGYSVSEAAETAQVSRQTVYNTIEDNRTMMSEWYQSVKEVLDVTDERDTGERP